MLKPLYRLALHFISVESAWQRIDGVEIRPYAFGAGSINRFHWYFEGESGVAVTTVDEICAWLIACVYTSDQEEFGVADYWQHPVDFEKHRPSG